ncbi:hypothetical protein Tco_1021745, partial [Tanacetum coccineum]
TESSTPSDSTAPLSPDHPLTHVSPTLVPILHRTTRMAMRVPPAMSRGLSTSIVEVAAMFDSAFRKRFRSSYESSPSPSPPDLPLRKRFWGTYELVEDDEEEEDEEIKEGSDYDSESKDAKDEGSTIEDEDPAVGDEGLATGDEGPGIRVKSLSLGGDKVVPKGRQRAAPVVETALGEPLRLGYRALTRWEIALGEGQMPSVFEVGQSSGFVPKSERPERESALRQPTPTTWIDPEDAPSIVPLPISSPMIPLTVPSSVASPTTAETEGFLTKLGARVEMLGGLIRDHKTDTHRAAMWHAISDMQRENQELRLQITEERCAWLDLAEIVDSMRRGQEPRGDV